MKSRIMDSLEKRELNTKISMQLCYKKTLYKTRKSCESELKNLPIKYFLFYIKI